MEINYPILGLVVLAVICLIVFLVRRNRKDEKKFEKEMTESEIKPEKHDEDKV
jgi:preprotein translocase subunit YajC